MNRSAGEGTRLNNVGFLRLLFASLVIVGHAPEMVDGNRSRDALHRVFGSVSLGELAVAAFFLLSGFLITKSMVQTDALIPYLERRILRIYPAFILASLLCVFVLAPCVHASTPPFWSTLLHIFTLGTPTDPSGAFPGLGHYNSLNGSMWTIAYEFRCYLLVALLWSLGTLQHRYLIFGLTIIGLGLVILATFGPLGHLLDMLDGNHWLRLAIGHPSQSLSLTTTFLVGSCAYLFWEVVAPRLSPIAAALSTAAAGTLMLDRHFAMAAMVSLGALGLFWLAFKANLGVLQRINDRWDISYGVYLYGWPVANTIRWLVTGISPWLLAAIALPIAFAFGAASWWGLERWAKDLRRSRSKPLPRSRNPQTTKSEVGRHDP